MEVFAVQNSAGKTRFIVYAHTHNKAIELANKHSNGNEVFDRCWYIGTTTDYNGEGERVYKELK